VEIQFGLADCTTSETNVLIAAHHTTVSAVRENCSISVYARADAPGGYFSIPRLGSPATHADPLLVPMLVTFLVVGPLVAGAVIAFMHRTDLMWKK
jgi:hypothetical protein